MSYWTELGWMIIPMNIVEIGFAMAMCLMANRLDRQK
jgi:hypothetical protein